MFTTGKSYSRKVEPYCHQKKKGRGLGRKKNDSNGCFMRMMIKMLYIWRFYNLKNTFTYTMTVDLPRNPMKFGYYSNFISE